MTDIEKLAPCPFCGGEARVEEELRRGRVIECADCGANVGAHDLSRGIAMWNHRADPAAGTVKDAERWRAFRARDDFDDLDFTSFQDQFREDADAVIDSAIEDRNSAGKD